MGLFDSKLPIYSAVPHHAVGRPHSKIIRIDPSPPPPLTVSYSPLLNCLSLTILSTCPNHLSILLCMQFLCLPTLSASSTRQKNFYPSESPHPPYHHHVISLSSFAKAKPSSFTSLKWSNHTCTLSALLTKCTILTLTQLPALCA